MKSWTAKQLTSISTCFLFHFISNQVKRLDFIIRWFWLHLMVEKSIQTLFYWIKLIGKKKHIIMFAKYLVNYISKRETCRYMDVSCFAIHLFMTFIAHLSVQNKQNPRIFLHSWIWSLRFQTSYHVVTVYFRYPPNQFSSLLQQLWFLPVYAAS